MATEGQPGSRWWRTSVRCLGGRGSGPERSELPSAELARLKGVGDPVARAGEQGTLVRDATPTTRGLRAAVVSLVLAAASLGGTGARPVTAQGPPPPAGCEQPYRQILVEQTIGHGPGARRVVMWPRRGVAYPSRSSGADLNLQSRWLDAGVDTDGDGRPDELTGEIEGDEQFVSLRRGDGTVTLSMPGHALVWLDASTVGDLDADGRDELLVLARPVAGGRDRLFVLPGTTAVGPRILPDVAVEVQASGVMGVGDQGGGPGDDVVVRAGDLDDIDDPAHRQTLIVSGDELMASGPGSSAALVPVVEPYDGFPLSVVDLGDERPAVISGLPWDTDDPTSSVRGLVLQRSGVLTRFELSEPFDSQGDAEIGWPPRFAGATAVLYAFPRRTLHLELAGTDRGGSIRAVWSIDDPCTELPVAGVPPGEGVVPGPPTGPAQPAPPAGSIDADATYTG